jgi:pimeloyl-ACP methyl ester carboxylesterase
MEPGDVLVGHSGGGFEITLAADAAPEKVGHLIYLAAVLPAEGKSLLEALSATTSAAGSPDADVTEALSNAAHLHEFTRLDARGRLECCDFAAVRGYFYHDVDEATARWAYDRLTPAPLEFLTELVSLPRFWDADLSRSFIFCEQDRAGGGPAFHAHFAERLGVAPLRIDSAHSPFLGKPRELAGLMVRATGTRPIRPPSRH